MTSLRYILRSLWFYRRSNLLLASAVAVTACLLSGALLLGNAMRFSLDALVDTRLGRVERIVHAPAGYFRAGLVDSLRASGIEAAAAIVTTGAVSMADDAFGTVPVTVYGVDSAFFAFGAAPDAPPVGSRVLVNRALARYGFDTGSRIRLQATPYRPFSTDSYMAQQEDNTVSFACVVRAAVPDDGMGRFGIRQNHYDRPAVFVGRRTLARRMDVRGRANLAVLGACDSALVRMTLRRAWRPEDHGYELASVSGGRAYELRSERVFIPAAEGDAVLAAIAGSYGVNTYFVNTLSKGYASVPYSFVSTANAVIPPRIVPDTDIILNDWTAARLFARPGDTVRLDYFTETADGGLAEESASFRVGGVVPVDDGTADPDLMPRFPGFSGALECRYWDPGVPIDMDRISDADERYWTDWQGTPKAYVSSAAFRSTWPNRYGAYTAIRFPADGAVSAAEAAAAVRRVLTPERAGTEFRNLRDEGRTSVAAGVDFGQLFLGLSFFIIAAALMLVVLLFGTAVEERAPYAGTLRALGFTERAVLRLHTAEGFVAGVLGAVAGSALGIWYQRALVWAMNRFWQDITTSFRADASTDYASLAVGTLATVVLVPLAQWGALRMNRGGIAGQQRSRSAYVRRRPYAYAALACGIALAGTAAAASFAGSAPLPVFFVMGALFIITSLAVIKYAVSRGGAPAGAFTGTGLVRSFMAHRGNRSVLVAGMLQAGTFIVLTIGLHHRATFTPARLEEHGSGSGGFSFVGESSLKHTPESLKPFKKALNRYCYGTVEDGNLMRGRVRAGDDASCLNITRARRPGVIGVDTRMLQERGSFGFAGLAGGIARDAAWRVLDVPLAPGVYPAAVDRTVMVWGLGKELGDTLRYVNSRGEPVRLVLVAGLENSVFQGAVLMSDVQFRKAFPAESGYSFFLIDTYHGAGADSGYAELQRAARRSGIFIERTAERLQGFAEVQNTYLSIFFVLGGFGLLLGCAGVGIVILKAAAERTYDYALLHAVGFSRGRIRRLLWSEHLVLLAAGIGSGAVAALLTAIPAGGVTAGDFPLPLLLALTGGLLLNGVLWITLASLTVGRGRMTEGLRTE